MATNLTLVSESEGWCGFDHQGVNIMPAHNLLDLPRELRDLIYPYVLPDRLRLVPKGCDQSISFHKTNGILLTTHQLRSEAIEALYRVLPFTIVVASCDVLHSILRSPNQSRVRQQIVNLVLERTYRKRNLPESVFSLASDDIDDPSLIRASLEAMRSLQLVVCELAWAPNHVPALLLPRTRECIIEECRRVTVGSGDLAGWKVDCRVKDKARWRNEWSGIVILTRTWAYDHHRSQKSSEGSRQKLAPDVHSFGAKQASH